MNTIITDFLLSLESEDKSNYTIENYKNDLIVFERWLISQKQSLTPKLLTFKILKDYRNYLVNSFRAKPATVNRKLATLHKFAKWCLKNQYIKTDPTIDLKGARKSALAPKSLIEEDLDKFMDAVYQSRNLRDRAIAKLLVNTGLRVGELVHLTLSDIDLSPEKPTAAGRGLLTVRWGKGSNTRVVPLNEEAREVLQEYLKVRPKTQDNHLLVGRKKGNGITESNVWRIINKYAEQSEVKLSPHTLRHTFGRKLIKKVDIVTVQSLLGHKNLNTTSIYTQPSQRDLEKAVEDLPELNVTLKRKKS